MKKHINRFSDLLRMSDIVKAKPHLIPIGETLTVSIATRTADCVFKFLKGRHALSVTVHDKYLISARNNRFYVDFYLFFIHNTKVHYKYG